MRNCCHLEIYIFGLNFNTFLLKAGIGLWHSLSFDLFCIRNCCTRYFISCVSCCMLRLFLGVCLLHHSYWDTRFIHWHSQTFLTESFHCKRSLTINIDKNQTFGKNNPISLKNFHFQSCFSYEFAILTLFCLHRGVPATQSRPSWAWREPWPCLRFVV